MSIISVDTGKHLQSNIIGKQTLNFQGSRSVTGFRLGKKGDKRSTQKKRQPPECNQGAPWTKA